jgi:hypothetical protein
MGPIFVAKRRMGYSQNVISHASFLLSDLVSCTVLSISLRNKQTVIRFSLILANKRNSFKHGILEETSHLGIFYMTRYLKHRDMNNKHINLNQNAILLNKKLWKSQL